MDMIFFFYIAIIVFPIFITGEEPDWLWREYLLSVVSEEQVVRNVLNSILIKLMSMQFQIFNTYH